MPRNKAPEKNQLWRLRSRHGRHKIFSSPEDFWLAATKYFEWCDDNPWCKVEAAKAGDHFGELVEIPTQRPYTLSGLCIHMGITYETFKNYCYGEAHKDFWETGKTIKSIIYTQKFEGAAVGAFNANIISRDLGLSEKSDNVHSGPGGGPIEVDHYWKVEFVSADTEDK